MAAIPSNLPIIYSGIKLEMKETQSPYCPPNLADLISSRVPGTSPLNEKRAKVDLLKKALSQGKLQQALKLIEILKKSLQNEIKSHTK